jgi:hypothetical protein
MVGTGTIVHWNGSTWTAVPGVTGLLVAVHAAAANQAWAVGTRGTILHWDGSAWTAEPSGTTSTLAGVWGFADGTAWAVGQGGTILVRR